MKDIKIGVSRIFNAYGFEYSGGDEFSYQYVFDDIKVDVFVGPGLRHTIMGFTFGPPQPKNPSDKKITRVKPRLFPGPEVFPADTYCEIIATKIIPVEESLAAKYFEYDKSATDEIARIANDYKSKFKTCLDYVCGLTGLQLSPFLIRTLITEQSYLYFKNKVRISVNSNITFFAPHKLLLGEDWKSKIKYVPFVEPFTNEWAKKAEVLTWLLRAWSAEDSILRFVALFIPLEKVIPNNFPEGKLSYWKSVRDDINILINQHANVEDRERLGQFVKSLRHSITIENKFWVWAEKIKLSDWEKDIDDFRRLKHIRDKLVHGSTHPDEFNGKLVGADMLILEVLAKKYISFWVFKKHD